MKKIVLITGAFPYGVGEAFVGHEIPILAKNFDEIEILTKEKYSSEEPYRPLPDNVKVVGGLLPVGFSKKAIFYTILKGFFSLPGKIDLVFLKEFFKKRPFSRRKITRFLSAYFTAKICIKSDLYQKVFSQKNVIFYYYWGTGVISALPFTQKDSSNLYITRLHSGDVFEFLVGNYLPLRKEIYTQLDNIFTIGNKQKDYLLNSYSMVDSSKVFVSRLGSPNVEMGPSPDDDEEIVIATCSRISAEKRLELILESLKNATKKITWHHIGGKNFIKQEWYDSKIEMLTKALPKNVKVVWHGMLTMAEVLDFYKNTKIDAFLNVSRMEGIPVSIMEAISFGIPAIATNVGATSEVVNDDIGKLISEDFKTDELLALIENVKSPEWTQKRERARIFWSENYDFSKNYNIFYRKLKDLFKEKTCKE